MDYLYAEKDDFSFLASGNVIKHFSGMPCFPVRLNLELFERARHAVGKERISVYDPCCGSGFSLTVLGLMRRDRIEWLRGSDIDPACLEAAGCNTSLLTQEGLFAARDAVLGGEFATPERKAQMNESVEKLLPYMQGEAPDADVFRHDILAAAPKLPGPADYVFADIPYGIMTEWRSDSAVDPDPLQAFLMNVAPVLGKGGVLTVCGGKDLRVRSDAFRRLGRFSVGKRLVYMLQKTE